MTWDDVAKAAQYGGAIFNAVPWFTLFMVVFVLVMVIGLLRFHRRDDNRYDLWDMVMSGGKADLNKHVVAAFAVVTLWVIVYMVQKDKPVETLLLGALGIFVAQRIATTMTNTIKGVPQDAPGQDQATAEDLKQIGVK